MRHLGLPRPSPPFLDQLTFQVRKRVAVILRAEHLPHDFLPPPIQTPLTESEGNLEGNFFAYIGGVTPCCLRVRGSSPVLFIQ